MEIRFNLNIEDLIAFHEHQRGVSDLLKKQRRKATIYLPSALILCSLYVYFSGTNQALIRPVVIFTLFYIFFISYEYKFGLNKKLRKLYSAEASKISGERTLTINEDGISEKTKSKEWTEKWQSVSRVDAVDKYAFIYVGNIQAFIIPKDGVVSGDFAKFVESTRSLYEKSKSTPLASQ